MRRPAGRQSRRAICWRRRPRTSGRRPVTPGSTWPTSPSTRSGPWLSVSDCGSCTWRWPTAWVSSASGWATSRPRPPSTAQLLRHESCDEEAHRPAHPLLRRRWAPDDGGAPVPGLRRVRGAHVAGVGPSRETTRRYESLIADSTPLGSSTAATSPASATAVRRRRPRRSRWAPPTAPAVPPGEEQAGHDHDDRRGDDRLLPDAAVDRAAVAQRDGVVAHGLLADARAVEHVAGRRHEGAEAGRCDLDRPSGRSRAPAAGTRRPAGSAGSCPCSSSRSSG